MHLLNQITVLNSSFAEDYRVHVMANGDVLLEVAPCGDEPEADCTFLIPAALRRWFANVMDKAARVEGDGLPRLSERFRLIEGGVGGTGVQ